MIGKQNDEIRFRKFLSDHSLKRSHRRIIFVYMRLIYNMMVPEFSHEFKIVYYGYHSFWLTYEIIMNHSL